MEQRLKMLIGELQFAVVFLQTKLAEAEETIASLTQKAGEKKKSNGEMATNENQDVSETLKGIGINAL